MVGFFRLLVGIRCWACKTNDKKDKAADVAVRRAVVDVEVLFRACKLGPWLRKQALLLKLGSISINQPVAASNAGFSRKLMTA